MDGASMSFRAIARAHGWPLIRLADELGMSPTMVSNRVRGVVPWTLPEAVQASKTLGMTLAEFAAYFPEGRKEADYDK